MDWEGTDMSAPFLCWKCTSSTQENKRTPTFSFIPYPRTEKNVCPFLPLILNRNDRFVLPNLVLLFSAWGHYGSQFKQMLSSLKLRNITDPQRISCPHKIWKIQFPCSDPFLVTESQVRACHIPVHSMTYIWCMMVYAQLEELAGYKPRFCRSNCLVNHAYISRNWC